MYTIYMVIKDVYFSKMLRGSPEAPSLDSYLESF